MSKLNQQGVIAQALILILLLLGAVAGVYLVQNRTNLLPKAGGSQPIGPQTSFSLVGPNECPWGVFCTMEFLRPPNKGDVFSLGIYARSDLEEANLFTAKIGFPKDLVEVKELIKAENDLLTWVEEYFDNSTGEISLSAGVPNPGYKTQEGGEPLFLGRIIFRAKTTGKGKVYFTDSSAIYSNLNNINILTERNGYEVSIEEEPDSTPQATPAVTPLPTCQPKPQCIKEPCEFPEPKEGWCPIIKGGSKGDGNKDGKIDLADMSILHSDWMKKKEDQSFRQNIDINDDALINTFDFSALRQILQEIGVIKVKGGVVKTVCPGGVNACGDSNYGLLGTCQGRWIWKHGSYHSQNQEDATDYWCQANAPDGKDYCYTCID